MCDVVQTDPPRRRAPAPGDAGRDWAREGASVLRTNLEGQTPEALWTKYIQLTEHEPIVEDFSTFRRFRDELGLDCGA